MVEFTWLVLLLLVPLVYLLLAVFDVQRASYGAAAASRSAGRAFVLAPDQQTAYARAEDAARVALADQGVDAPAAGVVVTLQPDTGRLPDARIDGHGGGHRAAAGAAGAGRVRVVRADGAGEQHPRRAVRHVPRGQAMTPAAEERGTVTVLTVGFLVVLGLLTAAVVDASAAYLRRQSMTGVADGAALAAADGAQGEAVYTEGIGTEAPVDPVVAEAAVAEYLRSTGADASYPGLSWTVTTTGTTVTVRLSAPLDLPLDPAGWGGTSTVVGSGSAVVHVE